MDASARQWHRINFGARGAGKGSTRTYKAHFGSLVVASFGFKEGPSPGFRIPKGVFNTAGSFFPHGTTLEGQAAARITESKRTKGIVAWNMFDAGPRVLAQRLGPAYAGLYQDWFKSAQKGKGPLSRVLNVPAPNARAFSRR